MPKYIIQFIIFFSLVNISQAQEKSKWDKFLLSFAINEPTYMEYQELEINSHGVSRFVFGDEEVIIDQRYDEEKKKRKLMIYVAGQKITSKNDYDDYQESSLNIGEVHKVILNDEKYIIIRYKGFSATGMSMSYADFIVIEDNQYFFIGDSYHGNQYCFADLDGDGDIDFLALEHNRGSYLWDVYDIQGYQPIMLDLDKPKEKLSIPTIPNKWVMDCGDRYLILTQEEINQIIEMQINPCDK